MDDRITPEKQPGRKKNKDEEKAKRDPPHETTKPNMEKPALIPPRVRIRHPSPLATYVPTKITEQSNKFEKKLAELDTKQRESKNSFKNCKNKVINTNKVTKTNTAASESESDHDLVLEASENLDNNSNSSNTPITQARANAIIIETTKLKQHLTSQLRAKERAIKERNTEKHRLEIEERKQNLAKAPHEYLPVHHAATRPTIKDVSQQSNTGSDTIAPDKKE